MYNTTLHTYPLAPISTSRAMFGEGQGQIWLDDMQCDGNESVLHLCRHRGVGFHNCGHREDAGVICSPGQLEPSLHTCI